MIWRLKLRHAQTERQNRFLGDTTCLKTEFILEGELNSSLLPSLLLDEPRYFPTEAAMLDVDYLKPDGW